MDLDDLYHLMIVLAILAWSVVAVGILGEVLGWWNDTGELLITLGTIAGVPVTLLAALLGAGRRQLGGVARTVTENNAILRSADRKLDGLDKLDKLDDLDVIQLQLDRQTGVLERQLTVLTELRDQTA